MLTEKEYQEILSENDYHLLGEIPVDDTEYEALINYSRRFILLVSPSSAARVDLRLAITLVQIAIREYKEGKYWSYFCEVMGEDISSSRMNYCGKVFAATVKHYGLLYVNREESNSQMYVENIKLHAIVTNYYMKGFYDFAYSYYEKNLLRQLNEDIEEDLENLSFFMQKTLDVNADSIVGVESKGRASKTYKLLKSTRLLFANADIITIKALLLPVLTFIDNYYYDSEIPKEESRFADAFIRWSKEQEQLEKRVADRKENRMLASKRPYLHFDFSSMVAYLYIPSQKFRETECDGDAMARIVINGYEKEIELEVYKSFGLFLSEQVRIPIPSLFDEIDIFIESTIVKKYKILKSNYRILNKNYDCVSRLTKDRNILLVEKSTKVVFDEEHDCMDFTDEYPQFDFFAIMTSDESVIHVGNKTISMAGEYSEVPEFEDIVEDYEVYDCNNNKLIVSRSHPTISFLVGKQKFAGTVLVVNGKKYSINALENKDTYQANLKGDVAVVITLESVLPKKNGTYEIYIDIPDEKNKHLSKYVRLDKLEAGCSRSIYIPSDQLRVWIKNGHEYVWPVEENVELVGIIGRTDEYAIPMDNEDCSEVLFNLDINEPLLLKVPVSLFKAGFSTTSLSFTRPEYLWYTDVEDTLYCQAPDVEEMRIYLNHEKSNYISGTKISENIFRIDISSLKKKIYENPQDVWTYINVLCKGKRRRSFVVFSVLRTLWVEPYFDFQKKEDTLCFDLNVNGNAKLVVDIIDEITKEELISNREIHSGVTLLPELSEDGLYSIFPKMVEEDEFGLGSSSLTMRCIYSQIYVGMDNLINHRLQVGDLLYRDERLKLSYDYFIDVREKVDETIYEGNMYGLKKNTRDRRKTDSRRYETGEDGRVIKKKLGKVRIQITETDEKSIMIKLFSSTYDEDNGWIELYYDNSYNTLLHCNDKILNNSCWYDRFVFLENNDTSFRLMKKKIRRIQSYVI